MKHTITCRVKDHPGVLSHIAGSFSEKGINIISLSVSVTEGYDDTLLTVVVGDGELDDILSHLNALEEVIAIEDLAGEDFIQRELVLLKVKAEPEYIPRITQLLELFDAPIVDIGQETMTIEFSGPAQKVSALIKLMAQFGILAVTRTGAVALKTGDKV